MGLTSAQRELLEQRLRSKAGPREGVESIPRLQERVRFPASFAQEAFWLINRLEPASPAYHIPCAYRMTGSLDVSVLEASLTAILERHEILRTSFGMVDGLLTQVVAPPTAVSLPITDLTGAPGSTRESEALGLMTDEARRQFDLEHAPLFRAGVVKLAEREHLLFLIMHHIIMDGWSVSLMLREMEILYDARRKGIAASLPEFHVQFGDFASWQRTRLRDGCLEEDLAYWRTQLEGQMQQTILPVERNLPATSSLPAGSYSCYVPPPLFQQLCALGRSERATMFMILLASLNALLARYGNQHEATIGTAVAGRDRREAENMLGLFINTVVLRTDLSGDPTFVELLDRVRRVTVDALAHQAFPFEKLVEALRPERGSGQSPFFRVMFMHQNGGSDTLHLPDLQVVPVELDPGAAKFDLTVATSERDGGLEVKFAYNAGLFLTDTVARMAAHLLNLLQGIAGNPGRPLSAYPLLSPLEEEQVFVRWHGPQTPVKDPRCLHHIIEEQATRAPDRIAVVCRGAHLTYRELVARTSQIAWALREHGAGEGCRVGLFVERSLDMIPGLLGILKAGAAYVPLDPAHPRDRVEYILRDASPRVTVTQKHLRSMLPGHTATTVTLDALGSRRKTRREERIEPPLSSDAVAYVIYTSGSTGSPKGVEIQHSALVNFLESMRHEPGIEAEDRLLAITTPSFDIAALELFLPLIAGACVEIATQEEVSDGNLLASRIRAAGATVMQGTPSTWQLLTQTGWRPEPSMKILCGGEVLPGPLAARLLEGSTDVWNMYGPTETCVWSTVGRVKRADEPVSIGRPIYNTLVYVLDGQLQPVPPGMFGELCIGGAGLARGYLNRPDITSAKFVDAAPSRNAGSVSRRESVRLYRTGDVARFLPDGTLELAGRLDHQVKIRGVRVELGEVEAVLRQHPSVADCVIDFRDHRGEQQLVAFVEMSPGNRPIGAHRLREWMRKKLLDQMVPSAVIILEAIPRMPNGKTDRKALARIPLEHVESEETFVPPRDPLEIHLAAMWEDILGVRPVGIRDDFFDLGGNSLLAARMFAEMGEAFNRKVPLATLFHAPTIEALSSHIRKGRVTDDWAPVFRIRGSNRKPPLIFVHAIGGNILGYVHLARDLEKDQPIYGLQPPGLDGKKIPFTSIEELAGYYVREIQAIRPKGPYNLGGFCGGGMIAFEIAQQLTARGESVPFLGLFDTFVRPIDREGTPPPAGKWMLRSYRERISFHVRNLISGPERIAYIEKKIGTLRRRVKNKGMRFLEGWSRRVGRPLVGGVHTLEEANRVALRNYRPREYKGRVFLFRPSVKSVGEFPDPSFGWRDLAKGGLEIFEVPGDHLSMLLEPNVQALSRELTECLGRLYPGSGGEESGDERTT